MRHQVIEEARRGNRQAFERLVGEVVDRLYGAAVLILHDRTAAEAIRAEVPNAPTPAAPGG